MECPAVFAWTLAISKHMDEYDISSGYQYQEKQNVI